MGGRGGSGNRNAGTKKTTGLGIEGLNKVLGGNVEDRYYTQPDFVDALAKADLEYNDDGEIIFKVFATNKETGKSSFLEVSGMDKKSVLNDVRKNGYTVSKAYTKQVYNAILEKSNADTWWNYTDATKVDNELLKRAKRKE